MGNPERHRVARSGNTGLHLRPPCRALRRSYEPTHPCRRSTV